MQSKQMMGSFIERVHLALTDYKHSFPLICFIVGCDLLLSLIIVNRVPYTEIDWIAYMQEVEGVLNGTYDYR